MKNKGSTLFKVSGILAIVIGALMCLEFMVVFPVILGVPLIIGGVEFLKYAELTDAEIKQKETTIIIWIVVFFIAGVVTGVLALIAYLQVTSDIKSKEKTNKQNETEVTGTIQPEKKNDSDVVLGKLEKLEKLKSDGLISEEEYNKLKEDLLNKK